MQKSGDGQPVLSPGTLELVENVSEIPQPLMTQLGQPGTSNSIDQVNLPPVPGTEWTKNQMAAGFQRLTQKQFGQPPEIYKADSPSTRRTHQERVIAHRRRRKQEMMAELEKFKAENLSLKEKLERKRGNTETENGYDIEANRGNGESEISEAEPTPPAKKKREADRKYRERRKVQEEQMMVDLEKFKAENLSLKEKLLLNRKNTETVPLWEWIFLVSNLTLELPSAVFDQLSSPHKPLYALMATAISLLALILCVSGLLYKGAKEGITFKWPRGKIPWFYYPSDSRDHKRFCTFADLIGLVSAMSQFIVTALNYDFARRAANSPIKFSLLPIIFALGLLCSRILQTVEKKASEEEDL